MAAKLRQKLTRLISQGCDHSFVESSLKIIAFGSNMFLSYHKKMYGIVKNPQKINPGRISGAYFF
jgi:hypothetical protein